MDTNEKLNTLLNAFVLIYTTYFLISGLNKSNKKLNEKNL